MAAFVTTPFRSAWRHRTVIRALTIREVQARFTGTMLGLGWLVLQPLASLTVYALVFGKILDIGRSVPGGGMAFVSRLFAGMIVLHCFSEPVGRASRLVVAQPNYVKRVVFPLDALPWPTIGAAALHAGCATMMLLLLHGLFVGPLPWTTLAIVPVLALVLLLALGVSWLLAAIGVFLRDTAEVVRVALQLLFFLSPVVWSTATIQDPHTRAIVLANPLATAIEAMRSALNGTPPPSTWHLAAFAGVAVAAACVGHAAFRRLREGFADVL